MSENVFIVWGKNYDLAVKVRDLLSKNGYFPAVGGSERGAEPTTLFINSNVIQGMDNASFAIVLVQRIFDGSGNPTSEFRPNLMFEWGYLVRRLRADAIHVFLIGIRQDELPSDLLGAYTHVIQPLSAKRTEDELVIAAEEITGKFLADVVSIDFDGLEIIQNYDQYRTILLDMSRRKRAFNAREAGYFLLHMIQPAFYRNDLAFMKRCLVELVRFSTGQFVQVAILIDQIIQYYDITEQLHRSASTQTADAKSVLTQGLLSIDRKLRSIRASKNKVYNIFDVLLEDFIGLANLRLYILSQNSKFLNESHLAFESALRECSEFQSIYPANAGFVRLLWEAYIERNLARVHFYKGACLEAKRLNELAQQKRILVSAQLSVADVPGMAHHFNLEYGLAKFDDALNNGAGEADLTEIFNDYLEPNVPRGVDRVWDRLYAAINREAEDRGYTQLLSLLSQIKLHS